MAKEMIISTSRLNSYGSRVITAGIDITQYEKNPVLLWMHRRSFSSNSPLPIGRVENLRFDGDALKGTPVFDEKDPFAKQIADKWEGGFLKMCSAGLDIVETSVDPVHLLPGQTRATVLRCKLTEVSIVDIGSNDDALQLTNSGQLLTLAAGEACEALPLLELQKPAAQIVDNANGAEPAASNNNNNKKRMKKETLQLLGLAEDATEEQVHNAVQLLKGKADKAQSMELAAITAAVDQAVKDKRITEAKRDHFIQLGKNVGVQQLTETLECMSPASKPLDMINQQPGSNGAPAGAEHQTYAKLSEVPADKIENLKKEQPQEYARLYKAEYGIEMPR